MTTTDPKTGERCRGFHVHVRAPKARFRKRAARLLARGFVSSAYTSGHGMEETLTLEEMKEVVL